MKKIFCIFTLLLITFLSACTNTIVLTDISQPIYQRSIGGTTANIPLAGTYTGTAPTHIQARVVVHGTSKEVLTWTLLTYESISGGNWSGNLSSVPQGAWYDVQVRESNATSIYANGSNAWGVGIIIAIWGQSNSLWLAESSYKNYVWGGSDYAANSLLKQYGGKSCSCMNDCVGTNFSPITGSWVTPTANGVITLGNALVAELNIPIGFHVFALGGSSLLSNNTLCGSPGWYWNGQQYALAKANLQSVTGTAEYIVWWQGWSDGYASVAQADYYAGLKVVVNNIASDFPGAKVLYVYSDNASTNVKKAFLKAIANGYGYAGADATGISYPNSADIGPASATTIGRRLATSILAMQSVH